MKPVALRGCLSGLRRWSAEDNAALRRHYGKVKAADLAIRFGRTKRAVFNHAKMLGINVLRRWTAEDDRRLRSMWDGSLTLRQIANRLDRTQTTTYWRAQKIGIPLECPPGFETLSSASERTGYDRSQVRYILDWAQKVGVLDAHEPTVRQRITRQRVGAEYRWGMVDVSDLDLALEKFHETESMEVAGRRLGVPAEVVIHALVTYGRDLPPRLGRRRPWRVASDVIDAAMAARAARESVTAAAKRHGLGRGAMKRLLERSGVRIEGRKQRAVVRLDVERAIAARAA